MTQYAIPVERPRPAAGPDDVFLIANGDLRLSANQKCWPAQDQMEQQLGEAIAACGFKVRRAHEFDASKQHGFIDSQSEGLRVFSQLDPGCRLIVAEAVWQYSHHVLPGLMSHRGPILTLANWSGMWPGLVGMLNLNGSLTKAGVDYSTLWSEDFQSPWFRDRLQTWLRDAYITHPTLHVCDFVKRNVGAAERQLGESLARQLMEEKAIMGVFDEGCMGMFNAIIPDHLLNRLGIFKERLSQSALYFEVTQIDDDQAWAVRRWMEERGLKFQTGSDPARDLTDEQILLQCKMYIAALRIADDFGCAAIGIQYQQGLKDLLPASDLVEGMLNNTERPPVRSRDGNRVLYHNEPLPHFNEVDECAGVDGLLTYRVHRAMGQPVENTLHDLRWGDNDASGSIADYVWVFLISGSAPPAHFERGWADASSLRQPPMYFPSGGGTLRGVSKAGEIVWSRIFIEEDTLRMDLGRGQAVCLPDAETERRWQATTPQWPIMHAVTYGVSRDQMMARHKSNHVQVVYANSADDADRALQVKATMAECLGLDVFLCGTRKDGRPWNE